MLDILPIQAWYGLCKCCVKEASNVKPLIIEAFNTVDHGILKGKLSLYGHRGKNLDWFSSYLTNRKQYIAYYYKKRSWGLTITCGAPQGSILGPLLFLISVNASLPNPIIFPDDTNLFSYRKIQNSYGILWITWSCQEMTQC